MKTSFPINVGSQIHKTNENKIIIQKHVDVNKTIKVLIFKIKGIHSYYIHIDDIFFMLRCVFL